MRIIRHQDLDAEQRAAADRMLDPYAQSPTQPIQRPPREGLSLGAALILVAIVILSLWALSALLVQIGRDAQIF